MKANKKINGIIDGTLTCKEEEKKLENYENNNEVKIEELPIHPNLSE